MANWQEKFKSWESLLTRNTDEMTMKCVNEIKQTIWAISKEEGRATLACKVLNLVCRVMNVKAGVDLFTSLAQYIFDKFWGTFLHNFKYFVAVLISKKQWNEALAILPIINKCKVDATTLNNIFYIYSTCYVSLVIYKKVPEEEFKTHCDQLAKLLWKARKISTDQFFDFTFELLGTNKNFQILMLKQLDGAASLLNFITNEITKCGSGNNFREFGEKCCMASIFLSSIDVRNKTKFTLPFLKVCMSSIKDAQDQSDAKILLNLWMLVSFLMKLLAQSDIEKFNVHFVDTLEKLSKLLRCKKPDESWLGCGVHMVSNILWRYSSVVSKIIDATNISSFQTLLETLFRVTQQMGAYSCLCHKTYCLECDKILPHSVWNLLLVQAISLRKSLQLQITDDKFGQLYVKLLDEAVKTDATETCPELKVVVQTAFREGYSMIKQSIQFKLSADVAYESLKAWRKIELVHGAISETQQIGLFKHLLKLRNKPRQALEMQCLYVANLIASPDSKHDTISQEMALCCSGYSDANMDYKSTMCDILDRAKFAFKVPAYDRKLATRLQLEASTKYAGVNMELKTFLAKQVIDDANDEIELANVLSLLGKISVSVLETKVDKFVNSMKKKLSTDRNDPHKYLALARLLIRQYQFILESSKESVEGKMYNEAAMHEKDLNDFGKFDIFSENKVHKVLVTARDNFDMFWSKVGKSTTEYDWNQIVEDISFLARHFTLRGYLHEAYLSWNLIHKLAIWLDLKLARTRAVSFFAEYSDLLELIPGSIDIRNEINSIASDLLAELHVVDMYTPRQQNYILIAIINIATYYHRQNEVTKSRLLVAMVQSTRDSLKERQNVSDLVGIYLLAFNFNLLLNCDGTDSSVIGSPYAHLHSILDAIGKVKHITSEDSINLPTFLFRVVVELAHFALYRLCSSPIRPFLYTLLHCIEAFSLGCRMMQIVSVLTAIDIQMERTDSSMMKLAILDKLLGKSPTRTALVSCETEKPKTSMDTVETLDCYDLAIEPARRVAISPAKFKQPYLSSNKTLSSEYLLKHAKNCSCELCENQIFQSLSYQIGCLHAQNYFINGDYSTSEEFFSQSIQWRTEHMAPLSLLEYFSFHAIFWSIVFDTNTLRKLNMFSVADLRLRDARQLLERYGKQRHCTYLHILVEIELSLNDLTMPHAKSERNMPNLLLETPVKTPGGKTLPLTIITSKRKTKEKSSKKSSTKTNDVDIISNLIDDWNLFDGECKENMPISKICKKSETKTNITCRKKRRNVKIMLSDDATSTSSSDMDKNESKGTEDILNKRIIGCTIADSISSSSKINGIKPKLGKASTRIIKQDDNMEIRRSSRARTSRC